MTACMLVSSMEHRGVSQAFIIAASCDAAGFESFPGFRTAGCRSCRRPGAQGHCWWRPSTPACQPHSSCACLSPRPPAPARHTRPAVAPLRTAPHERRLQGIHVQVGFSSRHIAVAHPFDRACDTLLQVIIATNIAETSITVKGVRYVVDAGFVKARSTLEAAIFLLLLRASPCSSRLVCQAPLHHGAAPPWRGGAGCHGTPTAATLCLCCR